MLFISSLHYISRGFLSSWWMYGRYFPSLEPTHNKSKEARDDGGIEMFQILEGWPSQIGMPKYWGWKEEEKRERGGVCDQTTKGAAKKKASISYMRKGTGIL